MHVIYEQKKKKKKKEELQNFCTFQICFLVYDLCMKMKIHVTNLYAFPYKNYAGNLKLTS